MFLQRYFSHFRKYTGTPAGLLLNVFTAIGILLLIMALYFYIYLPAVTNHGETITVPDITGMHVDELKSFLGARNLRYEVNDSSYSSQYPPLTVLRQFPRAGSVVKENRVIYISLNRINPPTVPMPDLIDGSLINADAVLQGNELKRGKVILVRGPFLNVVREMRYEGKKIEPGTRIPKGSAIDLVVEDGGSDTIAMPDVVGLSLEDAKVPIFGSHLNIGRIYIVGDTLRGGAVVLKQKPAAYENIKVGDVVELWVGIRGTPVSSHPTNENL
jgi:beta-lactam-binding protein with PASTA domain